MDAVRAAWRRAIGRIEAEEVGSEAAIAERQGPGRMATGTGRGGRLVSQIPAVIADHHPAPASPR